MTLMQAMISLEPLHRPTLSEVYAHPWVQNKDVATKKEIEAEFEAILVAIEE